MLFIRFYDSSPLETVISNLFDRSYRGYRGRWKMIRCSGRPFGVVTCDCGGGDWVG